MPLSLTQPQLLHIITAAACLFPPDRDAFVAAVAAELNRYLLIGDGTVDRAIRAVQCRFDHPEPEPSPGRWDWDQPRFERSSKRAY